MRLRKVPFPKPPIEPYTQHASGLGETPDGPTTGAKRNYLTGAHTMREAAPLAF